MSTLQEELSLGVPLREALAWIGARAKSSGNEQAEHACRMLAQSLGPTEVDVHVPVVHVLCQACDFLREKGELEAVVQLEKIIKFLKTESPSRLVIGTVDFSSGGLPIHAQLERIAKLAKV